MYVLIVLSLVGCTLGGPPPKLVAESGLDAEVIWRHLGETSPTVDHPRELLSLYSLKFMEKVAGTPVFLSGPHSEGLKVDSPKEYGKYNPRFLKWVEEQLPKEKGQELLKLSQPIYDRYFKAVVARYLEAKYRSVHDPSEYERYDDAYWRYHQALKAKKSKQGALPSILDYLKEEEAFWVRRARNGGGGWALGTLKAIAKVYDPKLLNSLERRYKREFQLLAPGRYRGGEVSFKKGQQVFGLYQDNLSSTLVSGTFDYDPVKDNMFDKGEAKTGKRVKLDLGNRTTKGALKMILVGRFTPGPIVTAQWESCFPKVEIPQGKFRASMEAPHKCVMKLGKAETILSVIGGGNTVDGVSYRVTMPGGFSFGLVRLLWAGDLDRDGKLDFLLQDSDHYNKTESALYLSSEAMDKKPLRKVASHTAFGC